MQLKIVGAPPAPVRKRPLLLEKDVAEYERILSEIIKVLEKMGGYEAAIDNINADTIARTMIYMKNIERFMDSDQATEDTYASVTDSKLKMAITIQNAMNQLALKRSDRIKNQTQTSLERELKEKLEREINNGEQ